MDKRENAKPNQARSFGWRREALNKQVILKKVYVSLDGLKNLRLKNQIGQNEPLDPLTNKLKKISRELIGFHNQA